MIMRFIKFSIVFLCLLLPLMLVGALLLLFVCPFVPNDKLRLPALFKWWDIVDDYIGRDTSVIKKIYAQGWWSRYCYIALRNPVNYFDYVHMGLHWTGNEIYTLYNKDEDNIGDGTRPGFRHIEVVRRNGLFDRKFFEYYWIYQYPFAKHVCFRFRMGWKIADDNNPPGSVSQWCFVISPWHNYTGK